MRSDISQKPDSLECSGRVFTLQYFHQFPISSYDEQSIEDESHIAKRCMRTKSGNGYLFADFTF